MGGEPGSVPPTSPGWALSPCGGSARRWSWWAASGATTGQLRGSRRQCPECPLFHLTSEHSGFSDLGRAMPGEAAGSNYWDCTTGAHGILFVKSPDWAVDFPACTRSRRQELPQRAGHGVEGGRYCRAQVEGMWTQSPARAGGGLDTHPHRWESEPGRSVTRLPWGQTLVPQATSHRQPEWCWGFPWESQMYGRPGREEADRKSVV